MQVKRKQEDKQPAPVQKPVKKITGTWNYSLQLPHGKYKNKTGQWVRENDKQYHDWMKSNDIWYEWGLQQREQPKPTPQPAYGYDDPPPWIELYEVTPEIAEPSELGWIQMATELLEEVYGCLELIGETELKKRIDELLCKHKW